MALLAALAVFAVASCSSSQSPSPTVCGGISSEAGGCSADRHTFTGSSCEDMAREWAKVLDGAIVSVLDGPPAVGNQARSVLLRQALVISTVDMNTRLQQLGLQESCDLPEFMRIAEPLFSAKLREGVGGALYDGLPEASYDEWLQDVRNVVRVIDDGEDPSPSASV